MAMRLLLFSSRRAGEKKTDKRGKKTNKEKRQTRKRGKQNQQANKQPMFGQTGHSKKMTGGTPEVRSDRKVQPN